MNVLLNKTLRKTLFGENYLLAQMLECSYFVDYNNTAGSNIL